MRWTSRTLFPVKFVGNPYADQSGELVVRVHFLGWNKTYDQIKAVKDLVPLKGQLSLQDFNIHSSYYFALFIYFLRHLDLFKLLVAFFEKFHYHFQIRNK